MWAHLTAAALGLLFAAAAASLAARSGSFCFVCARTGVEHRAEALEPVSHSHALAVLQTEQLSVSPLQVSVPSHILGVHLCTDTYSVQDKQGMLDAAEVCTKTFSISYDAFFQAMCILSAPHTE